MRHVLDDDRLQGPTRAEIHLRPARAAWSWDQYDEYVQTIEWACQTMGGVSDLLVPPDASQESRPWYQKLLERSALDIAVGQAAVRYAPGLPQNPFRRPPAVLTFDPAKRQNLPVIEVALPPIDNPWHLSYLTALGTLPVDFGQPFINNLLLREDISFDEFIDVARISPVEAGPADLARRITDRAVLRPTSLSLNQLTVRPFPMGTNALDWWLSDPAAYARQMGNSVVVVYTPGDIADLCLIWNLRAMHGWGTHLPLAVPHVGNSDDGSRATAELIAELVSSMETFLAGWQVNLVSESLSSEALTAVSDAFTALGHYNETVPATEVLLPATPPSRSSHTTINFVDGAGAVSTRNDKDRSELAPLRRLRGPMRLNFQLVVTVDREPVPPSVLLRREDDMADHRYTAGGCSINAQNDELVDIEMLSGWQKVRAVCADHELDVTVSSSGKTALALLRSIGDLDDVRWLAHRPLLALLYAKAASSGMTFWKRRTDAQARQVSEATHDPETALAALRKAIDDVSVSHGGESASSISYSELADALGGKRAAAPWLAWQKANAS